MSLSSAELDAVEVAHARFNAQKTLTSALSSEFETRLFGSLTATRDQNRRDPYYNRVLGLGQGMESDLLAALSWIREVGGLDARVDVVRTRHLERLLVDNHFSYASTLAWLSHEADAPTLAATPGAVRELSSFDHSAIHTLLSDQHRVEGSAWERKRHYYCTNTFRWFGIFDGDVLASGASIWNEGSTNVLGSAYTLPSHRGLGNQQQLLAARVASCRGPVLVDVAPGSVSLRNCLRAGFREVEERQVWVVRGEC